MVLNGFCKTQNAKYSVWVSVIDATTHEDQRPQKLCGRVDCEYASEHDCENVCSIVTENGFRFG